MQTASGMSSSDDELTHLSQETDSKAESRSRKSAFQACYLLVSTDKRKRGRSYIGYTVDPQRRERQHNGELVAGARKSRRLRPAEMAIVVHGFPSKREAMRFEWAWQHPRLSLNVREAAQRHGITDRVKAPAKRARILFEMINLEPWSSLPLQVTFTSHAYHEELRKHCQLPPPNVPVKVLSLEGLMNSQSNCSLCGSGVQQNYGSRSVLCPSCSSRFHVVCLADAFLLPDPGECIVPVGGRCPVCSVWYSWRFWTRRECSDSSSGEMS